MRDVAYEIRYDAFEEAFPVLRMETGDDNVDISQESDLASSMWTERCAMTSRLQMIPSKR